MPDLDSLSDLDRRSSEEARSLAARAHDTQAALADLDQAQVDRIVAAMAETAAKHAEDLAAAAVEETGFGVCADKVSKNLFAARSVYEFIRPMKTVGVLRHLRDRGVVEIAEPFGVVAAIVPSTNPTSTAIYKLLIAMKARCAIVLSPHPAAADCINRTVRLLEGAARAAGAPSGAIACMHSVTIAGTQELMRHPRVAVILATGGMGLVRAAYSAGKPAYGVGPGNAPAYIERSADVAKAVRDILTGKTFDNGLLCSSENSVVVDAAISEEVRRELEAQGGHFLNRPGAAALARVLVTRSAAAASGPRWPQCQGDRKAGRAPGARRDPRPGRAARWCRPGLSALHREAVPGAVILRGGRLAGGVRAVPADSEVRRAGPYDGGAFPRRSGDSGVRAQETRIPHRRQHAGDARLHRHDNGTRPVHDPGLRRLRRQRHVGQHLPATPAQHQASGLRDAQRVPGCRGPRSRGVTRPGRLPAAVPNGRGEDSTLVW